MNLNGNCGENAGALAFVDFNPKHVARLEYILLKTRQPQSNLFWNNFEFGCPKTKISLPDCRPAPPKLLLRQLIVLLKIHVFLNLTPVSQNSSLRKPYPTLSAFIAMAPMFPIFDAASPAVGV